MSTLSIILITVFSIIIVEILLIVIFTWGSDSIDMEEMPELYNDKVEYYLKDGNGNRNRINPPINWGEQHQSSAFEYVNAIFNAMKEAPPESKEDYLKNLPDYKECIDKSPNKFLDFHLKNAIKDEQYELAQHIVDVAKERGFNLKGNV
jgi:hypothetical protein